MYNAHVRGGTRVHSSDAFAPYPWDQSRTVGSFAIPTGRAVLWCLGCPFSCNCRSSSSSSSDSEAIHLTAICTNKWPTLSSVNCQVHCSPSRGGSRPSARRGTNHVIGVWGRSPQWGPGTQLLVLGLPEADDIFLFQIS